MGKALKKPPVYYTVAQVRFNQLLKLGDFVPSIQESFRNSGYPDSAASELQSLSVSVDEAGVARPVSRQTQQFTFANVEKTHSFVLGEESLALQSTKYGTFEAFSRQFLDGLRLVHEKVGLALSLRVGARYLDRVVPRESETLDQYLDPSVLGLRQKLGGELAYSYSETRAQQGNVTVLARVITQRGPLGFPPDLNPAELMVEGRFLEHEGLHAVLDTDGFVEERAAFDLALIERQLKAIHDVIGTAFKTTCTDHARKVWDEA